MADAESTNTASEAVAGESVLGSSFIPMRLQEELSPVAPAATASDHHGAPVIHAANADADFPLVHDPHVDTAAQADAGADLPIVHDPHVANGVATAARAAQASAYNVPVKGIVADAAYAGYPVDQTHGRAGYHDVDDAASAAHRDATLTDVDKQLAASEAVMDSLATNNMDGYTDARTKAQAQAQKIQRFNLEAQRRQYLRQAQRNAIAEAASLPQCTSGRQTMNILLKEQQQAIVDLNLAEEEFERVRERLDKAKVHKLGVDERIKSNAESLTGELLREKTRWNEMYERLVEYKQEQGHCHVLRNPKRNKSVGRKKNSSEKATLQSLGTWVGQVRLESRRPVGHPERLEPYKFVALDRLGFDWEPRENYWMDMFEQLKTYLEKSEGKMPPRFINNEKFALGQWCDTQLDNYRKFNARKAGAYITQDKIDMLNQLGFVWDKRGQMWRVNYDRLKKFKQQHGHCNATASNNGGDKSFGTWVTKQKRKYANWKKGETKSQEISLTDKQARLMDEIGFGESVEIDGRKLRPGRPKGTMKFNPLNGTIAGLVNASEEIEGKSDGQEEQHGIQQAASLSIGNADEMDADGNYDANMDPTAVANSWGDSANAVSLLVDAIMNKDGRTSC